RFGPVVAAPQNGLTWSATNAYALMDANRGNSRGIATWLAIGKARSVVEIKAAVSATLGIPWVNTIAADRKGEALIADITAVPNVSAEKVAACATPVSALLAPLVTLLDGTRSVCAWDVAADTPV
ncbi:MAG: penicillin acylase family protein, partial [Erythrobacter cryptus]